VQRTHVHGTCKVQRGSQPDAGTVPRRLDRPFCLGRVDQRRPSRFGLGRPDWARDDGRGQSGCSSRNEGVGKTERITARRVLNRAVENSPAASSWGANALGLAKFRLINLNLFGHFASAAAALTAGHCKRLRPNKNDYAHANGITLYISAHWAKLLGWMSYTLQ